MRSCMLERTFERKCGRKLEKRGWGVASNEMLACSLRDAVNRRRKRARKEETRVCSFMPLFYVLSYLAIDKNLRNILRRQVQ